MNKAFEKILDRLDKPQFNIGCGACPIKEKCDEVQESINDEKTDLCAETMRAVAKEIVQEVAEEYNITNGDKIRSMSDEELAGWFETVTDDVMKGSFWNKEGWIKWLRSEAE